MTTEKIEYLYIVRDVVVTVSRMRGMLGHELCPNYGPVARRDLKSFARLRKVLKSHLQAMRDVEDAAGHGYGAMALLGFEPHEALRIALCVLVAKALSSEIVEAEVISDLATLCAGRYQHDRTSVTRDIQSYLQSNGIETLREAESDSR